MERAYGLEIPQTLAEAIHPSRTALLVYDMQVGILKQIADGHAMAWQRVASVADVRPWFLRESPGFALAPELTPRPSEVVFDKITMSAFEGTLLDIALRDCGIHTVVVVGVATEVGIEPTARHAADLGYIPIVVTDACGAGHREAAARSIESLRFAGDAILSDVRTICPLLTGGLVHRR